MVSQRILDKATRFVKVARDGEELIKVQHDTEDFHINILNKKQQIQNQLVVDQGFIARVESALQNLKVRIGAREYDIFGARHFKIRTIDYIAIKMAMLFPVVFIKS